MQSAGEFTHPHKLKKHTRNTVSTAPAVIISCIFLRNEWAGWPIKVDVLLTQSISINQ